MKQNKKPFLLMTIVVTLVVVLLGVNMSQYLRDPGRIKDQKAPNEETMAKMKARQAEESVPDDVQVGDVMQMSNIGAMGGDTASLGEVPSEPSIELPRLQEYKSAFTTDTTSAQWWKENSKQQQTSEERAGIKKGSATKN